MCEAFVLLCFYFLCAVHTPFRPRPVHTQRTRNSRGFKTPPPPFGKPRTFHEGFSTQPDRNHSKIKGLKIFVSV